MSGLRKKDKASAILYFVTAILFLICGMISKKLVYVPLACLYIVLGMRYIHNGKSKLEDD